MSHVINSNGVDLCIDTIGRPGDPAILLMGGASSPMDWWDDDFCARLAAGGRFVIRYDNRDTGESVHYPAGEPAYTGSDLVEDAIGVLDALGLTGAHLVGVSMGGALAQVAALRHRDRVNSLVLIDTSPATPGPDELPSMTPQLRDYFGDLTTPDWTDHAAVIGHIIDTQRHLCGPDAFDEKHDRAIAARIVGRTHDLAASMTNHNVLDQGTPPAESIATITVPTLVLHGTADPLFPIAHGRALADAIPDAELIELDGVGHQSPPPATWPTVIPAILRITSGGWNQAAGRMASRALAEGEPTAWFDRLYAAGAAGEVPMPWDRSGAHALLAEWADGRSGTGKSAIVVGCGLGSDAEYVAGLGYATTAFDIAPSAVAVAAQRHPGSSVDYTVANLLDLPHEWSRAFDLVVEIFTVQALPDPPRSAAIRAVSTLVAPGGTLIVIAFRDEGEPGQGPPWPLSRDEIEAFAVDGVRLVSAEEIPDAVHGGRWRASLKRDVTP